MQQIDHKTIHFKSDFQIQKYYVTVFEGIWEFFVFFFLWLFLFEKLWEIQIQLATPTQLQWDGVKKKTATI